MSKTRNNFKDKGHQYFNVKTLISHRKLLEWRDAPRYSPVTSLSEKGGKGKRTPLSGVWRATTFRVRNLCEVRMLTLVWKENIGMQKPDSFNLKIYDAFSTMTIGYCCNSNVWLAECIALHESSYHRNFKSHLRT